ncbi:MAG: hypothetical protein D6714_13560, partial [Bacteroidetes bacterium]
MKKVGFVTADNHPELYYDDRHLEAGLWEAGIQMVPVVWDQDADLSHLDALVFRSAWDYHLKTEAFEAWLDELEKMSVPVFNPVSVVRKNYDKFYLKELSDAGVSVLPTRYIENIESVNLKNILKETGWEKAVIKPAISMSAYGTRLIDRERAEAFQSELVAEYGGKRVLIQEFAGEIVSEGEWSMVFFDKHFCTAFLKRPQAGDFRVQSELGGSLAQTLPPERVIWQAQKILFDIPEPLLYA